MMSDKIVDIDMDLSGHLDELRRRLIYSVVALVALSIVAFFMADTLIQILFAPSQPHFCLNRWLTLICERFQFANIAINQTPPEFINTKMAGQFNLHIKSAIFMGFITTMPFLLWQLWSFVRPAINSEVATEFRWMVLRVTLLFFVGLLFGYIFIAPLTINFLVNYNFADCITNYIDASSYITTVIKVVLASSLIFQLPHLVYILARIGVLTSTMLIEYRRVAIVVIVTLSAILTPPDVFSQILLAIPFYLLYEYGISVAKREEKRRKAVNDKNAPTQH